MTIERFFCLLRDIFLSSRIKVILFRRTSYGFSKASKYFSVKDQIVSIFGFVYCKVSVVTTQFAIELGRWSMNGHACFSKKHYL